MGEIRKCGFWGDCYMEVFGVWCHEKEGDLRSIMVVVEWLWGAYYVSETEYSNFTRREVGNGVDCGGV